MLALAQGAGTDLDTYEAGTERKRAYIRSLQPEKLGLTDVGILEDIEWININVLVPDKPVTQEVYIWEEFDTKRKA